MTAGSWVLIFCFFAFVLRVYSLSFESLDIDEADVVAFARQPMPELLGRLLQPGENGPLYVLMLRGWAALAGESELSLRFFSVVPSVLSVPLIFILSRRLLGTPAGLVAAVLLACSSYGLFYAQMVKMYSLVLMLALLSCYLLLRGRWAWYAVATTVAMHVHVFGALLVPWHAAYVLLRGPRERGFFIALAVLVVPYVPLGVMRAAALQAPETLTRQFTGPRDPFGMLITLAREYGTRYDLVSWEVLAGAFGVLTVMGLVAMWRGSPRSDGQARAPFEPPQDKPAPHALLFLGLGLLVPVGMTYLLVVLGAPLFASRYLLVTLPVFYLLWAAAIAWLFQELHPHPDPLPSRERGARPLLTAYCLLPAGALLVAGFLLLNGARWAQTAFGGERFREDWRGAVAYLEQRHAPGEPVLVLHDASFHAVDYYRAEPMALTSLEGGPERPPDLSKAPSTSGRTWLLAAYFEAPDLPSLEAWLEARGQLANKTWLTGVMVSEYTIREGPMANRSGGPAAVRSCHSTHARRQDSPPSKRGSHPSTCPPPPE